MRLLYLRGITRLLGLCLVINNAAVLVEAAATPAASATCTVTAYTDVASATASCTSIVLQSIAVPAQKTLDLSKLKTGTTVTFSGKTTFAFYPWTGNLIQVGGTDIHINSASGAIIDGNGPAWWDGQGSNGGIEKPDHFFTVSKALGASVIENLYIQNYPTHCFSVTGSTGLVMQGITLNNTAGNAPNANSSGLAAGHNTDGFGVSSSTNILLQNNKVYNQDDCVAITSGTNITARNLYCDGGHGLSIGSIGGKSDNNVTGAYFEDSVVLNSQNGPRIKTNSGTTGSVSNVLYSNITVSNTSIYGIDIQQDYLNGGPTGSPTNGVTIQNVFFKNIHGTAQSKAKDYYILCGSGSCSNITFSDVKITGGTNDTCNYGGLC